MCGIAGVYQLNGHKLESGLVESIGKRMRHRGPDNFSYLETGRLGLSHNRLSLLDLSPAANQPFADQNYILAYNGEIYNYREIRQRLEREHNVEFKTTSDTEVLFYSLIHDGVYDCLKGLKGMFAFSFYDRRNDELWLARDRLGIKPLYYIQKDGGFFWSSEIKALAQALNLKPDPLRTLFSINGSGERSNEHTLFKGVHPVKPGTSLKVEAGAHAPREFVYYNVLSDFEDNYYEELNARPAAEVLSEFERLFTASVESMLVSDAPLGAFVSGGIDSSLIAAIANKSYPQLQIFTANIIGKYSEFEDAKALSEHIAAPLHDYKFEPEMMLSDWAEATFFYECPIVVHTNSIPFSRVAKLARETNVKAVLTGEGADELFLGYPRLLTRKFDWLAKLPVTIAKSLYKFTPRIESYLFPKSGETSNAFVGQLVQNFHTSRLNSEADKKLRFLDKKAREEQFLTIQLLGDHMTTLLHRNDRMGMMASIEARFPFLNEELIKFAVNLPAKYKIAASRRWHNYKHPFLIDKWIVRKTAEKFLPPKLFNKKKNGFPMVGHKFVRVNKDFFKNGWVSENLSLSNEIQNFLVETQNEYFIAKLASVEIFGRLYGHGESVDKVKEHVLRNARMNY